MTKALDFNNLSFSLYQHADQMLMFESYYRNQKWDSGKIVPFHNIELSPAANILNYGQGIFEGMKAYRSVKNSEKIVMFRPMDNARRFRRSCRQLAIPEIEEEKYMQAVRQIVDKNRAYVPQSSDGSHSMYLRPVCIGTEPLLGVRASREYLFYIYASPVGPYFANVGLVRLIVTASHRAATHGTGNAKAVCNYAVTMKPRDEAIEKGFDGVLFLDAVHDRYVEEAGAANVFVLMDDGKLVTPKLGSILPGITRDSVIRLAREKFGLEVVETDLDINTVCQHGIECFLTGTGAIITAVSEIGWQGKVHSLQKNKHQLAHKMYDMLIGIQLERYEDPFGWVQQIA